MQLLNELPSYQGRLNITEYIKWIDIQSILSKKKRSIKM